MRSRRKRFYALRERWPWWALCCLGSIAVLIEPTDLAGELTKTFSSAQIPAVLLTCGLLSAVVDRRK